MIFDEFNMALYLGLDYFYKLHGNYKIIDPDSLEENNYKFPFVHCSNSAGILDMPQANLDLVRAGIILYGMWPSDEVNKEVIPLLPVLSLKSHITYIKEVKAGTPVSYNGIFITSKKTKIATIPVGYADGYPRALSNQGRMLVHGQFAPILGRVCMDQTMIDVSDIADVVVGDEVVLFGKQKENVIPVEEIAEMSASFNYEAVCDVNRRVPRIYYRDGKVVSKRNYLLD